MTIYLVRRLLQSVVFILLASLLVYTVLVMFMPDGPNYNYNRLKAELIAEGASGTVGTIDPFGNSQPSTADRIKELERVYKLDKPWPLNFAFWLFDPSDTSAPGYDDQNNPVVLTKGMDWNIFGWHIRGSGMLTGDFGVSTVYATDTPISDLIRSRWVSTVLLLGTAFLASLLVGVPMGVISASRRGSFLDHAFGAVSTVGLSFPPYILGLLLVVFLAIVPAGIHAQGGFDWLPWLPPGGAGEESFARRIGHLALPALTLSLPQIAWISRQARLTMLDVLQQDYIRSALAKGASMRRILWKHALKNALIPVIAHAGLILTALISGATVVENVFAFEGLGKSFFASLGGCLWADINRTTEPPPCPARGYHAMDYPLALALFLIIIVLVSISTLIADMLYTAADPRISYEDQGSAK